MRSTARSGSTTTTGSNGTGEINGSRTARHGTVERHQTARRAATPLPPNVEIVRSPTEKRNGETIDIDLMSTVEVLRRINAEDQTVPHAVAAVLPELASAVDRAVGVLRGGGRLHYFGAGTSGRLAALDAAELPPTFGIEAELVVAHHAGGRSALTSAAEGVEDDVEHGARDAAAVRSCDLALGLSASGRTPYIAGALTAARRAGAWTVLVSANPQATLGRDVDVHIGVDTGAEVIAGSTRMKAGTAQKLVLNAFSTAAMVRLGYTYSNLMIGVTASNAKLRGRMVTILAEASGQAEHTCADVLAAADGDTRVALVSLLTGADVYRSRSALRACTGSVREAIRRISAGTDLPGPREANDDG